MTRLASDYGYTYPKPFTTRQPRGLPSGIIEYDHLTYDEAAAAVTEGRALAEEVMGDLYGYSAAVPRLFVPKAKIALQATSRLALRIKALAPSEPVLVFLRHPDDDQMRNRLEQRYGYDQTVLSQRIGHAREELSRADSFDYDLTVDDYEAAFKRLLGVLAEAGDA